MNILAIGAHPDDIEILCAGTLALYSAQGHQVLTIMLMVVVSWCTTAPKREQVEPFAWRPTWLRSYDETGPRLPWWQQVKVWFSVYALAWCYIYWHFW